VPSGPRRDGCCFGRLGTQGANPLRVQPLEQFIKCKLEKGHLSWRPISFSSVPGPPEADLHMNRNGIATPIPISIVAPATAAPRQTSAMTVSDWNLVWLLGTALPHAFPMQLFILYSLSGGGENSFREKQARPYEVPRSLIASFEIFSASSGTDCDL